MERSRLLHICPRISYIFFCYKSTKLIFFWDVAYLGDDDFYQRLFLRMSKSSPSAAKQLICRSDQSIIYSFSFFSCVPSGLILVKLNKLLLSDALEYVLTRVRASYPPWSCWEMARTYSRGCF
uniref:Uncharacterized protein n=1 Tax=Arundo donax TaxID=35708 RepID=A0A0A9CRG7_ARUDO